MAQILVADDEHDLRELVSYYLESSGHEVVGVDNGLDALTAIGSGRYDAVVLDHQMPGMSGLEVIRRCPAVVAGTRPVVVMMSALGDATVARAAREAGATDFLSKPFPLATLLTRLEEGLAVTDRVR